MINFAAMFKKINILLVLVVFLAVSACNNYQKIIKKGTPDEKYALAQKYYDKGDYFHALQMYDELIVLFRGTPKIEQIYYNYAYCHYKQKDYVMASYHFKYYAKTFPQSPKAEECLFMSAQCKYFDSAEYNLDQTSTKEAIEEMQLFINIYPNSTKIEQANNVIDELRLKLIDKDYQKAKLLFHTEDYYSAVYAFEQHIKDYPSTPYREEAMYLIIQSKFNYADRSIYTKQKERFEQVLVAYNNYYDKFPEGKLSKAALKLNREAQQNITKIENSKLK